MIKGIHHTGLSVKDLDASIKYFETGRAFECVSRFKIENTELNQCALETSAPAARGALLKGPTGFLEINQFEQSEGMKPRKFDVHESGIRHICLQDKDVDPFFDAHLEAGASWHARPSGLGTGALYSYIRDPEGNVLELEGVPWSSSEGVRPWYAHTAFVTPDIKRLSAFYERLTGIECHRKGRYGPHKNFDVVAGLEGVEFHGAWIKLALGVVEMWEYEVPRTIDQPRPDISALGWNHICFEVDSAEREYNRLKQMGLEIHSDPVPSAFGISFYARDPDGNIMEFLEPSATLPEFQISNLEGLAFLKILEEDVKRFYKAG